MRSILLVFIIILFIGCGRDLPVNGKEVIMTNDIRLFTQNRTLSTKASNNLETPFIGYYRFDEELLNFERTIPNMMRENISIWVWDLKEDAIGNRLLDKDTSKEFDEYFSNRPLSDWEINNYKERGVNYYKNYVDFIGGLKCTTSVESQNIADGVGNKTYFTTCPYYNKQGVAKHIIIDYQFYYTFKKTKFEGSNAPSLARHRFEEIQLQFKKDMKKIFDSLVIHNMDKKRMEKDGLLYGKKYSLDSEFKVKDKSMNCTYVKKTDSFICIGKKTKRKCTRKRGTRYKKWQCEYKK